MDQPTKGEDALFEAIRDYIAREVTALEARCVQLLNVATSTAEAALAATEATTTATHDGNGDDTRKTLDSLERRASRHADHLAGLESRVKRLERGS